MTDLLLSMTPILTWFQICMVMVVFHNMHNNHKPESCYSHEKQYDDFLGNFHIPRLFHDFPWQQFFPGFSMTVGTLMIGTVGVPKSKITKFSSIVTALRGLHLSQLLSGMLAITWCRQYRPLGSSLLTMLITVPQTISTPCSNIEICNLMDFRPENEDVGQDLWLPFFFEMA